MKPALRVTLIKSLSKRPFAQRLTVRGLGLRQLHHSVTVANTPSFRGMVAKVIHLVRVEEIDV